MSLDATRLPNQTFVPLGSDAWSLAAARREGASRSRQKEAHRRESGIRTRPTGRLLGEPADVRAAGASSPAPTRHQHGAHGPRLSPRSPATSSTSPVRTSRHVQKPRLAWRRLGWTECETPLPPIPSQPRVWCPHGGLSRRRSRCWRLSDFRLCKCLKETISPYTSFVFSKCRMFDEIAPMFAVFGWQRNAFHCAKVVSEFSEEQPSYLVVSLSN